MVLAPLNEEDKRISYSLDKDAGEARTVGSFSAQTLTSGTRLANERTLMCEFIIPLIKGGGINAVAEAIFKAGKLSGHYIMPKSDSEYHSSPNNNYGLAYQYTVDDLLTIYGRAVPNTYKAVMFSAKGLAVLVMHNAMFKNTLHDTLFNAWKYLPSDVSGMGSLLPPNRAYYDYVNLPIRMHYYRRGNITGLVNYNNGGTRAGAGDECHFAISAITGFLFFRRFPHVVKVGDSLFVSAMMRTYWTSYLAQDLTQIGQYMLISEHNKSWGGNYGQKVLNKSEIFTWLSFITPDTSGLLVEKVIKPNISLISLLLHTLAGYALPMWYENVKVVDRTIGLSRQYALLAAVSFRYLPAIAGLNAWGVSHWQYRVNEQFRTPFFEWIAEVEPTSQVSPLNAHFSEATIKRVCDSACHLFTKGGGAYEELDFERNPTYYG